MGKRGDKELVNMGKRLGKEWEGEKKEVIGEGKGRG